MNPKAERIRKQLSLLLPDIPKPVPVDAHPKICERVFDARTAFLQGFREALKVSPEEMSQLLEEKPFYRRGFALEGAAMALTLIDEFSPVPHSRLGILLNDRSTEEKTLGAIGVGWASARLGKSLDWLPTTLHPCYMSAVADGYGFHQGFFHSHRFTNRGFPVIKGDLKNSYDIGLGRALWFVNIGRAKPIIQTINRLTPDRRKQLWRGVGIACAFTGNAAYAAIQVGEAAAKFESHFRVGIKVGIQLLHNLAKQKEEIL